MTVNVNVLMSVGDEYRGPAKHPSEILVTNPPLALRGGQAPTINVSEMLKRSAPVAALTNV